MYSRLLNTNDRFVFISGSDAPQLRALTEITRYCESDDEFIEQLKTEVHRESSKRLQEIWNCADSAILRQVLSQIEVQVDGEKSLKNLADARIGQIFLTDHSIVRAQIVEYLTKRVGQTITLDDAQKFVRDKHFILRRIQDRSSALLATNEITNRFTESLRERLIGQRLIASSEIGNLFKELESAKEPNPYRNLR